MKLLLLFIPLLLIITSCDTSPFLGNIPQNPETVENGTNNTVAVEINLTVNGTPDIVEETTFYFPSEDNLSIYIMDVEGQSIIIQREHSSLLLDAGTESSSQRILKNLRNLGIDRLDKIILTNSKEDNVGGLPYIITRTSPANVYDSGSSSQSSSYHLYRELYPNITLVPKDNLFMLDDIFIRMFVNYDEGTGFLPDLQDNSIVTKITFQSNNFLFMSNCGFECLEKMKKEPIDSDVLVIDGTCDSTTLTFIQKVNPKVVVSTGELCKETEDRFKFLNIPVYYKSKHGDIKIDSDGINFALSYQKTE